MDTEAQAARRPPIPNSYWVQPDRLLAGEYPGSVSRAEAMERVRTLLDAGVSSFVDLTEEGELPEYEPLLPGLTERRVRYRRLPIMDHGVPDSPAQMARIVDLIESELAAGRCVYVHCRAGIGRTGMTIGCHLIRGGLDNEAALERLQVLWQQCARAQRWPSVPETSEQVAFVRRWRDAPRAGAGAPVTIEARYEGALLGLAAGEAIGLLVSMKRFDATTLAAEVRDSPLLRTGADTATTRALAESLIAHDANDPEDQMRRYLDWARAAEAVPAELRRALAAWQWSKKPHAGSHDPNNLDAHSLSRTLAVALYLRADAQRAIELAAEASRTTQQSPPVLDLCRVWAATFIDALAGTPKETLAACAGPAMQLVRKRPLKPPLRALLERPADEGSADTDAFSVTRRALSGFAAASTLRDALLRAEASWHIAPTSAALCGALAGAHYGTEAIPAEWRRQLPEDAVLRSLARHLLV